jgi:hypothetical protein
MYTGSPCICGRTRLGPEPSMTVPSSLLSRPCDLLAALCALLTTLRVIRDPALLPDRRAQLMVRSDRWLMHFLTTWVIVRRRLDFADRVGPRPWNRLLHDLQRPLNVSLRHHCFQFGFVPIRALPALRIHLPTTKARLLLRGGAGSICLSPTG